MFLLIVLKSIVGANQTAYVEGRFIGEATRLISDILEVTKECNIPGYMVMMDVEKAFDSMDHGFLIEVLKIFVLPGFYLSCYNTL